MKIFQIILFLVSNILFGQDFHLAYKFNGDLNGDKKKDEIRILEKACGKENICRKIEIYILENKKLKLVDKNTKLLSCQNCSKYDYPFSGIEFEKKTFFVNFLIGGCDKTYYEYEFKINSKNKFELNSINVTNYNCNKVVNGEVVTEETNYNKNNFGYKTFKETNFIDKY